MSMNLNMAHYDPWGFVVLSVVFALVILYWVLYTTRLKVRRTDAYGRGKIGQTESIAMATDRKERTGRTGTID